MHSAHARLFVAVCAACVLLPLASRQPALAAGERLQPLPDPNLLGPPEDVPAGDAMPADEAWYPDGVMSWPSTRPTPSQGLPWLPQFLPDGLVWRSYLAGVKEPRFALVSADNSAWGTIWDSTLGGRVSLLRYGTPNAYRPEGWEVQFEGAAMPRLWPTRESSPLISCDYRVGIPLVYANGNWQFKTGYSHLSAHLGDEFMVITGTLDRSNYIRDSWMFAVGYFYTENLRLYAEMDYAFVIGGGSEPFEFQFGFDYSPAVIGGAPFAAMYGNLREELNFGGYWVVQAGWQWRGGPAMRTFRVGVEYINGAPTQYEFTHFEPYAQFEQQVGIGVWYDY